jgi:hypothetical protein
VGQLSVGDLGQNYSGAHNAPFGVALDRAHEIVQQLEDGHQWPGDETMTVTTSGRVANARKGLAAV